MGHLLRAHPLLPHSSHWEAGRAHCHYERLSACDCLVAEDAKDTTQQETLFAFQWLPIRIAGVGGVAPTSTSAYRTAIFSDLIESSTLRWNIQSGCSCHTAIVQKTCKNRAGELPPQLRLSSPPPP
jgi:hypothetical protein